MKTMLRRLLVLCLLAGLLSVCAAEAFSDVSQKDWYYGAVTRMAEEGMVLGDPEGTFRPEDPITAAEFVAVTARIAGLGAQQRQTGHWAGDIMAAALAAGWYDWDEIPPTGERFDLPISRQLAVKIMMRAILPWARGDYLTESAKIADFAALDGRYYDPVLAAYGAGIILGDAEGTFRHKDGLSRAEACTIFLRAEDQAGGVPPAPGPAPSPSPLPDPVQPVRGGVRDNGWLQFKGARLCNQTGEPVVLRGMSTHGLQWYDGFTCAQSIRNTASWGANLFRVAMYTGEGGYLTQPEAMKRRLTQAVDNALAQDMYVIIDWHILSDGNPSDHTEEAVAFFTEMAERYSGEPGVLYEICNEPNGSVSWSGDVKPYAEQVIRAIRKQSPRAVILVGSPTWSQDVHLAAADPLDGENLMYTLHFYAGTHGAWLRQRAAEAMDQGLPIFVSEWGTSDASGSGGVYARETGEWMAFLRERGVSWANWSLCDKNESSAALKPGTAPDRAWGAADLTESGRLVAALLAEN